MQHFLSYFNSRIGHQYTLTEQKSVAHLLLQKLGGLSRVQIYSDKDTKFTTETENRLRIAVNRLAEGEPIQYILGETEFYNLPFLVNPAVLIPRPETEELVELILKNFTDKNDVLKLLDIGTGSGCIAISLAKNRPNYTVSGWDVSEEALTLAIKNAELNQVKIHFNHQNILQFNSDSATKKWNIIVSNPPYVCQKEKTEMERHVLNHEPHLALFVSDEDPLIFYRVISDFAIQNLEKDGILYFEINSHLGEETKNIVGQYPFEKVELFKDLSGRDRMIRAIK